MHQAGARHLADVAGTFSGPEWAPQVEQRQPAEQAAEYPLWQRATMDTATAAELLRIWRLYGDRE